MAKLQRNLYDPKSGDTVHLMIDIDGKFWNMKITFNFQLHQKFHLKKLTILFPFKNFK